MHPIKEAYEHPAQFAEGLIDNPLTAWDNVFLPAAMIHGTAKGIKEVTPNRIKKPIAKKYSNTKEAFAEFRDDFKESPREAVNTHVVEPVVNGINNIKESMFGVTTIS